MKRFLITISFLACFTITIAAQTPTPIPAPAKAMPTLTADQQKVLKDAVATANQADAELQATQAKSELAKQRFFTLLYGVMAERGIKPSEYSWKITDQGVVFEAVVKPKPNEEAKKP